MSQWGCAVAEVGGDHVTNATDRQFDPEKVSVSDAVDGSDPL